MVSLRDIRIRGTPHRSVHLLLSNVSIYLSLWARVWSAGYTMRSSIHRYLEPCLKGSCRVGQSHPTACPDTQAVSGRPLISYRPNWSRTMHHLVTNPHLNQGAKSPQTNQSCHGFGRRSGGSHWLQVPAMFSIPPTLSITVAALGSPAAPI